MKKILCIKFKSAIMAAFLLLFLMSCFLSAWGNTTSDKPVKQLRHYLSPVNTLQADFIQVTTGAKGKRYQTTKGYMQIRRPAFFRWQVKSPFPQLLVSNGKKIWIYDQTLEQVTIRGVDEQAGNIPAAILSGDTDSISKNYRLSVSGPEKKKIFSLVPKNKESLFDQLQLLFSSHQLDSMIMTDSLGTKTTINFSHVKKNLPIKSSSFVFIPPKKVDVLDETQQ